MEILKVYEDMEKILIHHQGKIVKQKCEAEQRAKDADDLLNLIVDARIFITTFDPLRNDNDESKMQEVTELIEQLEELQRLENLEIIIDE